MTMSHWFDAATWQRLWADAVQALTGMGLRLILITFVYWLVRNALFRVVDGSMARLQARRTAIAERSGVLGSAEERLNRIRTLQTMVKSLIGYALFFVYALTVLQTLDINITGIVTTAGVAGIAVGFGAQKLVRDVISGFFIVSEDHFAVGDYVTIAAASGVVEDLSLRTTRLRDDQGRVWVIPNGDIGFVLNHSRGPVISNLEIQVPAVRDVQDLAAKVNAMGTELAASMPDLFSAAPQLAGLAGFDASGVTVRVTFASEPKSLGAAQMALRERLRNVLIAGGYLPAPET
jgi:small conductance mechanosensitive channel